MRYLLTLPLNFVPVVGTAFFLGYNGESARRCLHVSKELTAGLKAGPGYHARYFQLKGFDKEKRQAAISKRRGSYTG